MPVVQKKYGIVMYVRFRDDVLLIVSDVLMYCDWYERYAKVGGTVSSMEQVDYHPTTVTMLELKLVALGGREAHLVLDGAFIVFRALVMSSLSRSLALCIRFSNALSLSICLSLYLFNIYIFIYVYIYMYIYIYIYICCVYVVLKRSWSE